MFTTKRIFNILLIGILASLLSSCKQVKLKDADSRFAFGEYAEAASMYHTLYKKTSPKNRDLRGLISFRMAECYRLSNNTLRANAAYANATRYIPKDSLVSLQYARSLHKEGKYHQAAAEYKKFLTYFPHNQFAINGLKGTMLGSEYKEHPTDYTVRRMSIFNSSRGEFSPMLLPPEYNHMYITSSREQAQGSQKSPITGLKNNDLFMARKSESGTWLKPDSISGLNTPNDEGTPSFSAKGDIMYYTYCDQSPSKRTSANIYISHRTGGSWSSGKLLPIATKDTISVFAHPAISPSGKYLYFTSDVPGGYGGKDIYRALMQGDSVQFYENLGPQINTAGDEMFPYVRNDSTIYFSSDGHPGMGGLDIFKATWDIQSKKWRVENMQYPINSEGDDFGITFEGNIEQGFFSSNRKDGRGSDHIYSFSNVKPTIKIRLEGFVVDKDDNFIPDATIRVVGIDGTNEKFEGNKDGTYRLQVDKGTDYVLMASAEGFLNAKMDLKTANIERDTLYYVDFVLPSIKKPSVLENIFYDFNKATLRDSSKIELDGLVQMLIDNPNATIELSAHTDRKGSDTYNDKLSLRRAQSVVDYLLNKGIKKDRLKAAGYGKTQPKTVTKNNLKKYPFFKEGDVLTPEFIEKLPKEQQENADQLNRRTEFKVLSITYGLK